VIVPIAAFIEWGYMPVAELPWLIDTANIKHDDATWTYPSDG
jgi:hypothetical protein